MNAMSNAPSSFASFLAAISLSADVAGAHEFGATDTLVLDGRISGSCTVQRLDDEGPAIDLTKPGARITAQLQYRCNAPGGFARTIASENRGQLRLTGQGEGFPYRISHEGAGLTLAARSLDSPATTFHNDTPALRAGQTGELIIEIAAPTGAAFAGVYRDRLEVTVRPNY